MKQNIIFLNTFRYNKGFTLVEVIAVLVIIGILATIAASKISTNNQNLYAIESALKSHIRYAQLKAMQSDTNVWGIRMNRTYDNYWLFYADIGVNNAWGNNRTSLPGSDSSPASSSQNRIKTSLMNVDLNTISVGGSAKNQLTLVFNDMGVPFWREGGAVIFLDPLSDTAGLTQLTTDIIITLIDNDGNSKSITISSETGFVQ